MEDKKMDDKIITLISIWYVSWFLLSVVFLAINKHGRLPKFELLGFDLLGNNVLTFAPASLWLIWHYFLK